jgi:hypothetical protein
MTKLTQKQLVDLFNDKLATHHKAMADAKSNYEKALIEFVTQNFDMTKEEWEADVEDHMSDPVTAHSVNEIVADNTTDAPSSHYLKQERTLGFLVSNLEGDEEWMDMNTSV